MQRLINDQSYARHPHTCCVCVVGTGACMYMCTCNVKASPPPSTQIYGAEVWRRNSEQGEGGDWSEESGTREGGEAKKICGGVQGAYKRERDDSGKMDDLIKTQNWHIPGHKSERIFVQKKGRGGCYPRVLHPIRIKWCELTGGLAC